MVVGDGHSAIHEAAVVDAFKQLGHEVEPFYWHLFFKASNQVLQLWRRAQNKFLLGPVVSKANAELIQKAVNFDPKIIFIYRGTHVTPQTVAALKKNLPQCLVYGYNNDDPFAEGHPPWLWRHFIKSVPLYDIIFAYRHRNFDDFARIGAKRVELLRSWFIPSLNYRASLSNSEKSIYDCDVVFIGHYEKDGRLECLEEIAKTGVKLKLYGPPYEWNHILAKSAVLKHLAPVRLVWNEEYNKALCGAKIALCFFSKLNRDTYTRRCFEIPATGTLLLSEYSSDLATIYREGESAAFFKTSDELVGKVRLYLGDDVLRNRIASNGYQSVRANGHDVVSRMKRVVELSEMSVEG